MGKVLILGLYTLEVFVIWYFYIKSLDTSPKAAYDFPQIEISQTDYIDAINPDTGKLTIQGWTRAPNNILYNQSLSTVYWPILSRTKQWNYFYVVNDNYLVTMAHANIGVIKSAYVNILDIKDPDKVTETLVKDFFDSYVHIDPIQKGKDLYSTIVHPELNMTFRPSGGKDVGISINSKTEEHSIIGEFTTELFKTEGLTVLQDQSEDGYFHEFNTKVPLELSGELKLNGKTIMDCTKTTCLGLHDYGRTIGKYMNSWIWGTTVFRTPSKKSKKKTHKVGINISLAEKENVASGTAVFIDDKLLKLDSLVIKKITDDEWSIKNYQGKSVKYPENQVDLKFKVTGKHKIHYNFYIVEVDFNSNFGFFSGSIKTKEHDIKFDNKFGFIEEMFSRW